MMQPLICQPWEVRRLLDGSLTVIVRPVVFRPPFNKVSPGSIVFERYHEPSPFDKGGYEFSRGIHHQIVQCPFPAVGEQFYVQEEFRLQGHLPHSGGAEVLFRGEKRANFLNIPHGVIVKNSIGFGCWYSAELMPEEFSRLKPEVVSVEIKKLGDVIWGGVDKSGLSRQAFFEHWRVHHLEGQGIYDPFVWGGEVKV